MVGFDTLKGLVRRLTWLIRLRWIAAAGVALTITFAVKFLNLSLPARALYAIALALAIYNLIFLLQLRRIRRRDDNLFFLANRSANLQIFFDLAALAALIHFSGGIENPFIFYFIFHMIIASILLSRRAAFLQATYAVFLFLGTIFLEYSGRIPHYCLKGVLPYSLHGAPLYILGVGFVFTSTLYIAVYMATSISKELRERERGLREANKLLHEKDRIKSEYVLRVTHDIKEDLAAIQACVEPVSGKITGELNVRQEDLLRRATARSKKLIAFVNALLDITKIKLSEKIKMEYFAFQDLAKDITERVGPMVAAKGLVFEARIDPEVERIKGVRVYLQEAVLNLLMNALKYTPRGGRITFRAEKEDSSLLIEVEDTGIGVPRKELSYIFDEFYRATNAKKQEKQGTGLGLSITKEIVEMHSGRIEVKSEEGRGSRFKILLPTG